MIPSPKMVQILFHDWDEWESFERNVLFHLKLFDLALQRVITMLLSRSHYCCK